MNSAYVYSWFSSFLIIFGSRVYLYCNEPRGSARDTLGSRLMLQQVIFCNFMHVSAMMSRLCALYVRKKV